MMEIAPHTRPFARALAISLAAGLVLGLAPVAAPAAATCTGDNANVWFVGVVYDPEQRADVALDIDNVEAFLGHLREVYCIPDDHAKIFAHENFYSRNGEVYDAATETAVKKQIATFGAEAATQPDPLLFFMLSSHGIMYANRSCSGVRRAVGSLAGLKASFGNDGDLYASRLRRGWSSSSIAASAVGSATA